MMGYYSDFYFSIKNVDGDSIEDKAQLELICHQLNSKYEVESYVTNGTIYGVKCSVAATYEKWYDYQENLTEYSKLFPLFVFDLYRTGEEPGDVEKITFKDGKIENYAMKIIFEKLP